MPWQKHSKHLFLTTCAFGGKTKKGKLCLREKNRYSLGLRALQVGLLVSSMPCCHK